MQDNDIKSVYDSLRELAFANPREARATIDELLKGDGSALTSVLKRVSGPGDGRLRQLIANAARTDEDRRRLRPYFAQWLTVETDEFARLAIEYALRTGVGTLAPPEDHGPPVSDPLLVEMYRYVTGRVGHELRNVLLAPKTRLLQLRTAIQQIEDAHTRSSLESLFSQFEDDFARVGQACAFEPGDDYFAIQSFVLCEWIKAMNLEYAQRYNAIDLSIEGSSAARQVCILGSRHLLRTIFWNLWLNSHQATEDPCRITIAVNVTDRHLNLVMRDNGDGIPDHLSILAFKDQVSARSPYRGRGLLEVGHAIGELHGKAYLKKQDSGEYRVALVFPMVVQ